jgi:hypothetical protein
MKRSSKKKPKRAPKWVRPTRLLLAIAFLLQMADLIRSAGNVPMIGTVLRLGVAAVLIGAAVFLQARYPEVSRAPRPSPDDPRHGPSGGDQIVGKSCADCNERIVTEASGRACDACGAVLHHKLCLARHQVTAHAEAAAPYR